MLLSNCCREPIALFDSIPACNKKSMQAGCSCRCCTATGRASCRYVPSFAAVFGKYDLYFGVPGTHFVRLTLILQCTRAFALSAVSFGELIFKPTVAEGIHGRGFVAITVCLSVCALLSTVSKLNWPVNRVQKDQCFAQPSCWKVSESDASSSLLKTSDVCQNHQ